MKLIEAQLILDEKPDEHTKRDADTKTECIDERIQFSFLYVPYCNLEVISNHNGVD
jgi:hypothetical protein